MIPLVMMFDPTAVEVAFSEVVYLMEAENKPMLATLACGRKDHMSLLLPCYIVFRHGNYVPEP